MSSLDLTAGAPSTSRSPVAELLSGSLHDYLLSTSDPDELADALAADLEKAGLLVAGSPDFQRTEAFIIECRLKADPEGDWQELNGGHKATLPEAQARLRGVEAVWVRHEYRILHRITTIATTITFCPPHAT